MRAKAHLDLKKNGAKWNFDFRTPESILPHVTSKKALEGSLEYHSNPHIKMHTLDDPKARRQHVEQVRPALRWFCKKYGMNIPTWLEGNMHYDELPPEQFAEMFGEGPLNTREFEEHSTEPENPEVPGADTQ